MISAKPAVVAAMLALVGAAIAKEKTGERRIAELIEQTGAGDHEVTRRVPECPSGGRMQVIPGMKAKVIPLKAARPRGQA